VVRSGAVGQHVAQAAPRRELTTSAKLFTVPGADGKVGAEWTGRGP